MLRLPPGAREFWSGRRCPRLDRRTAPSRPTGLAVESSVDGAIDAEGSRGKRAIRDERVGWKMRTADPAERAGTPELSAAADLAGEDNFAAIVDDHEFEGRREFACFRGAYQARHL